MSKRLPYFTYLWYYKDMNTQQEIAKSGSSTSTPIYELVVAGGMGGSTVTMRDSSLGFFHTQEDANEAYDKMTELLKKAPTDTYSIRVLKSYLEADVPEMAIVYVVMTDKTLDKDDNVQRRIFNVEAEPMNAHQLRDFAATNDPMKLLLAKPESSFHRFTPESSDILLADNMEVFITFDETFQNIPYLEPFVDNEYDKRSGYITYLEPAKVK